jgi:hypothetical protein
MLNSEYLNRQAQVLANRLRREASASVRAQVQRGLYLVTSRPPNEKDIARGLNLIEGLMASDSVSPNDALDYFCLMALNMNEMIYLD